ncbi:CBS domain-containing protein [Streptomyces sp. NPDC026092]|uniref:CBS domain-containing protein n=1 Tax=Streptomyces sp. NPDC026092 TaxID=3154797 RepID=UPI0034114A66
MTPVQTQHSSTHATLAPRTVVDAVDPAGPHVCDDMTVEVALSVMVGARTGHLLVCDNDGQCTGLVTRAQLTAVRDSAVYTDRLQLRDLSGDGGPLTSATALTIGRAVRPRVVTPSVVGEQDDTPGAPAPTLVLA